MDFGNGSSTCLHLWRRKLSVSCGLNLDCILRRSSLLCSRLRLGYKQLPSPELVLSPYTTFVTGMINKFSQLVPQALFDSYNILNGNGASVGQQVQHRQEVISKASFIFSI
jgi:hypothetical protein